MSFDSNSFDGLGMIISEVRYITGVNKTIQLLNNSIDSAKMEAISETIKSQLNKSILSTALKFRHLITNTTDAYFAREDAKTIINLFIHASKIPLNDQHNLENTCKGICSIIASLNMLSKTKRIARVKGSSANDNQLTL